MVNDSLANMPNDLDTDKNKMLPARFFSLLISSIPVSLNSPETDFYKIFDMLFSLMSRLQDWLRNTVCCEDKVSNYEHLSLYSLTSPYHVGVARAAAYKQRAPDIGLSSSSSSWASREIQSLQCILCRARGVPLVGHSQNTPRGCVQEPS